MILAGGKSSRMGQDKSVIAYHGKPQVDSAFELLSPACTEIFLSHRRDQSGIEAYKKFSQLHYEPEFEGKGPLAGILSAMKKYPDVSWFVLACDLPFVGRKIIERLIQNRDPQKIATAYKSSHDGLPEPLCAFWEAGHYADILKFFNEGIHCPRKVLIKSNAHLLDLVDPKALDNINDLEEYKQAVKVLKNNEYKG